MGSEKKSFCILSLSSVLAVLFMVFSSVNTFAGNNAGVAFTIWPDTGQTKCYDNGGDEIPCPAEGEPFYGQDAQYQGPQRSYTKLGYGGVELPDSATVADGWIMTRDDVTGLIWEIKTNKDDTKDYTNPHDADNTYTWCDHNPATNGGNEGTCGDGTDTEDFISDLNSANFGGFSDWRLPTINELLTLLSSSMPYPGPIIDAVYFQNTVSDAYWSSTTLAFTMNLAWAVDFAYGYVGDGSKGNSFFYVRAVRSGKALLHSFIDNHDGTITDTATGLMWQKCSMGQTYNSATNGCEGVENTYTWQQALAACEDLVLAGYNDWRLPNRNELQSIVDYSKYAPSIDTVYFPDSVSPFWSSTTYASSMSHAWLLDFSYGYVSGGNKGGSYYVRAVRSGRGGSSGDLVNLDISRSGTGSGIVTSTDGKISCGSDCSDSYSTGTTVTLTASPDSGSIFSGWGGDCKECGISSACNIAMNKEKNCNADFILFGRRHSFKISQTPMFGPPGTIFYLKGEGFSPNSKVTISISSVNDNMPSFIDVISTDSRGVFEYEHKTADDQHPGSYYWAATDNRTGLKSDPSSYEIVSNDFSKTQINTGQQPILPSIDVARPYGSLQFVGNSFDPEKDTFVIIHGMNIKGDDDLPEWVNQMANSIAMKSPLIQGANVFAWNWQEKARIDGIMYKDTLNDSCIDVPGVPYDQVEPSAVYLVDALETSIPDGYNKDIHLIGHSLGSLVAVFASKFVYENKDSYPISRNITHLVLLDPPCYFSKSANNFLKKVQDELFVENYRSSMLGTRYLIADTYIDLLQMIYNVDQILAHEYAHEWYRSSITNFQDKSILGDSTVPESIQPWGFYWWNSANRNNVSSCYEQILGEEQWYLEDVSCNDVSFNHAKAILKNVATYPGSLMLITLSALNDFVKEAGKGVTILAANTFNSISDISELWTDVLGHAFIYNSEENGFLRLIHHSDAVVTTAFDVPAEVNAFSFGFKFPYSLPGTTLEVFLDGQRVFSVLSENVIEDGYQMAPWIDISSYAGRKVQIAFRISNPAPNAEGAVDIDDLIFAKVEPVLPDTVSEAGDANGDGQINVLDVISVINKILNPNTSLSGDADCNGDGTVNVLDVICIINKILLEV